MWWLWWLRWLGVVVVVWRGGVVMWCASGLKTDTPIANVHNIKAGPYKRTVGRGWRNEGRR